MKCLAKSPEQRWASVAELGAALRSVGGIESIDDFAPSSSPRGAIRDTIPSARLRTRRRGLFVGLAGGVALGIAIVLAIVQRGTGVPDPATTPAPVVGSPAAPVAAPSPAPERTAVVHVVTDPPGAKVKEEGETLCEATPCDVLYRGASADPSAEHLLALLLPGYKLERAIATTAAPVVVKLTQSR
jgi:hypothetical protein